VESLREKLPKLPDVLVQELVKDFHLSLSTAQLLVKDTLKLAYFRKYLKETDPQTLANLIINKKIDLNQPPQLKTATAAVDPKIINEVLKDNADVVAKFKAGKTSVIGFLVGQVMRLTQGKVDPKSAQNEILKRLT